MSNNLITQKDAEELISYLVRDVKYIASSSDVDINQVKKIQIILDFLKRINHLSKIFDVNPNHEVELSDQDKRIIEEYMEFYNEKENLNNISK